MRVKVSGVKSPTCLAGHSHHAFLLLPKADVVFEGQEVKQKLKKVTDKFKTVFCILQCGFFAGFFSI